MSKMIDEEIRQLIADDLSLDSVVDNADLGKLGADRLDVMDITARLEEKYNIRFPKDYMPRNAGQIITDVKKYIEQSKS